MNRTVRTMMWGLVVGILALNAAPGSAADYYVAQSNQTPASPYTSWATAASNIQEAVDVAVNGDTVWVAPGTYGQPPTPVVTGGVTNMLSIAKWITVRSSSGNPADTIIDAGDVINKRCVRISTSISAAPDSTARLSGFTLTNGYASGGGLLFDINNWSSRTGIVDNCIITDNRQIGSGAGIRIYYTGTTGPDIIISNTVVRNNQGDGIYKRLAASTTTHITHCRIENNTPHGAYLYQGHTLIENTEFSGNTKTGTYGAALSLWYGTPVLRNCLFYKNHIDTEGNFGGAAISASYTYPLLDNCTIVSNTSAGGGATTGGLYAHHSGGYTTVNSIVYFNYRGATHANFTGAQSFSNSCIYPVTAYPNANNIDADPLFADREGLDFRLTNKSPCLNQGLYQPWMDGATDLDGMPRIDTTWNAVDMGCYEYFPSGTLITVQ